MSVSPVGGVLPKGGRDRDERRKVEPEQTAQFDAAMRKRRRSRQPGVGDAEPTVPPPPAPPAWWWMLGGARAGSAATAACGGPDAGSAEAIAPPDLEAANFAPGAQTRLSGNGLHVRFTQGAWAGMELQASLHAGQVVVTLRPLNRQQHKRLVEAKSSLGDEVARQTGEVIRLEVADATR
ncbi:hypothetical protein J5T34_22305 [Cupriavidus gilardii]|uniref:hypothetical protein n=1 Tax=Cupriavidus gilardii TaxID=82541 RepID=UPI001ABEDB51|nr:hypothetical protein [Cupriavidus gilardii]MBO4123469.1 hypothetical protein [Cupriavidus gilardii]